MKAAIGRIHGTRQESAEYEKKGNAKATVDESKALAMAAAVPAIATARLAVLLSVIAVVIAGVALVVTVVR